MNICRLTASFVTIVRLFPILILPAAGGAEFDTFLLAQCERARQSYPYEGAKGPAEPQRVLTQLSLVRELGEHLRYVRSLDPVWAKKYRLRRLGNITVCMGRSAEQAHNTVIERVAMINRSGKRAPKNSPYRLGDWCVHWFRQPQGAPTTTAFIRNNIAVVGGSAATDSRDKLWRLLRVIDKLVEDRSVFVEKPDKVQWVGITDGDTLEEYRQREKAKRWREVVARMLPPDLTRPLPARGSVSLSTKVFAPEEICDVDARSATYVMVDLIRRSDTKTTRCYVKTWIYPSVADAEKAFVEFLVKQKFPPERRLKDGPGRACYGVKKRGICFLMANVVYYSKGEGFGHIAIGERVAKAIEKARELKEGQEPKLLFTDNRW